MNDELNSSQMICTKSNYDEVRKEERERSFSPPLDNLVDILEECNLTANHQIDAIQLQSKLHSPSQSSNSSHLNHSINSNISSQLNDSNNSNQLNLSSSQRSNESNRSIESDHGRSQIINYLSNHNQLKDRSPPSYSKLNPNDFITPEKQKLSRDCRSVENRVRYASGDSPCSNIYRSNLFPTMNRPRSNSEGKSKKPNMIMSTLRKPFHLLPPWQTKHSNQSTSCPITPNSLEHKTMMSIDEENSRSRQNSGNSTNGQATFKSRFPIVDRFRNRSLSMGYHDLNRKCDGEANDNLPSNSLPRRHSVDPEHNHQVKKYRARSVDFADFHQSHFSLYREPRTSRSGSYFNPFTSTESICDHLDFEDLQKDESLIYLKFFKFYLSYDLIPKSSKLVVFDTQLIVKKAFYALVNHGVRAAPLWCSKDQSYVGMLTITYFINVLINSYNNSDFQMNELEEQKIENWRNLLEDKRTLITIDPESSVLDAIETLIKNKIHRLPIVDPLTNNVIYILTHKRILKFFFLYCYYLPMPSYMNFSLEEVDVGTYSNIELIELDAKVIDAMRKLVDRRVSALPVVDENGKLVDIYSKFDIFNLAAEKLYDNLDMTVKEALQYREHWFEGVVKCTLQERFITILERIVKAEVHRIVVVNDDNYVVGIISLSDILQFLTLRPIQLFAKKLIPREPINEDLDEELFHNNYNNNDYSLIKNSLKDKEIDLCYNTELQKIDEI